MTTTPLTSVGKTAKSDPWRSAATMMMAKMRVGVKKTKMNMKVLKMHVQPMKNSTEATKIMYMLAKRKMAKVTMRWRS